MRLAGWALLAGSARPAWNGWGASVGLALWTAVIGFAACGCTLLISFRPAWVPRCAAIGLAAGLATLLPG